MLLCTRLWRNDLVGLYTGVASGYALLIALFVILIARTNWQQYANEAQERAEKEAREEEIEGNEQTPLTA